MNDVASQDTDSVELISEMRPRRWYTDEIAPTQPHRTRLTATTWRYRALKRSAPADAAPAYGAASVF